MADYNPRLVKPLGPAPVFAYGNVSANVAAPANPLDPNDLNKAVYAVGMLADAFLSENTELCQANTTQLQEAHGLLSESIRSDQQRQIMEMLRNIQNTVTDNGRRLTGVEDRLTRVDDRLTRVEDRLTRVEDKLDRTAAKQSNFLAHSWDSKTLVFVPTAVRDQNGILLAPPAQPAGGIVSLAILNDLDVEVIRKWLIYYGKPADGRLLKARHLASLKEELGIPAPLLITKAV